MLSDTKIVYLDKVWPIVTGCSYGCPECFARRIATRFKKSFTPTFHPEKLGDPARRKKPTTIGVAFHGDLFDPGLTDTEFYRATDIMRLHPRHNYVLLTKRAEYMRIVFTNNSLKFPRLNWFLGVTVRNQSELDAAAPHIEELAFSGWKVWLSIEPMQGPIFLHGRNRLSGVILGGQSGPKAPPLVPNAVRVIRDQCASADVPFFFKQASDAEPWHEGYLNGLPLLDGCIHDGLAWGLHGKKVR